MGAAPRLGRPTRPRTCWHLREGWQTWTERGGLTGQNPHRAILTVTLISPLTLAHPSHHQECLGAGGEEGREVEKRGGGGGLKGGIERIC